MCHKRIRVFTARFSLSGEKGADGLPGGGVCPHQPQPLPITPRSFKLKARMGKSIYKPLLRKGDEGSW